jgi:hypothetical protein
MAHPIPVRAEIALDIASDLAELGRRARRHGFNDLALQIEFAMAAADQAAATAISSVTRSAGSGK